MGRLFLSGLLAFVCAYLSPTPVIGSDLQTETIVTLIPTAVVSNAGEDSLQVESDDQGRPLDTALLRFVTRSLPESAHITRATLRLVWKADPDNRNRQTIDVISVSERTDHWNEEKLEKLVEDRNKTEEALGGEKNRFCFLILDDKDLDKDVPVAKTVDLPPSGKNKLNIHSSEEGTKVISLLLWPTEDNSRRVFRYSNPSREDRVSANQPRLILRYTVRPSPPPVFQSDGLPAVRSPRAFLPGENPSVQNSYIGRKVTPERTWSHTPAFYNHLVYTLTEKTAQKYLDALAPLGALFWSAEIPAPPDGAPKDPGRHLVGSNSGRLYVVGNQRIIVFQLDPDDPLRQPIMLHNLSVPDLNPDVPPTVGPDGSLYFMNLQQVYGLNPDLQELWKVVLAGKGASRLSVGPSGEFVYFTARNEGLVAINAQTGEYFAKRLPNQEAVKGVDHPGLHTPVVIRHPDGTEKIYVAADAVNRGVLACFDNFKTNPDYGLAKGRIEPAWKKEGLFSQPGLDPIQPHPEEKDPSKTKKLYSVKVEMDRGRLIAMDWLDGSTTSEGTPFPVGEKAPFILNGGNLALDKDGNLFLWNGDGGRSNLSGFNASLSKIFDVVISRFPPESQLLFGNDGTLYAHDIRGRVLRAVLPQYTLGGETVDTTIYSPTHLWIDGTAGRGKEWVLKAGGSVLLGKGFVVEKGTTLNVQVGVRN